MLYYYVTILLKGPIECGYGV